MAHADGPAISAIPPFSRRDRNPPARQFLPSVDFVPAKFAGRPW